MSLTLWILIIVAVIALWLIATYNGLMKLKIRTEEAESDIDVQLKRRHDLIPNVVETVKGYASHEKALFERVTQARSQAMQASGMHEKAEAENMLTGALKSLFAVSENYPDLKASQNFLRLQDELSDTENKIQAARRFYNSNVRDFNTKLQVFPTAIIGRMFGFHVKEFFDVAEAEKENVRVSF